MICFVPVIVVARIMDRSAKCFFIRRNVKLNYVGNIKKGVIDILLWKEATSCNNEKIEILLLHWDNTSPCDQATYCMPQTQVVTVLKCHINTCTLISISGSNKKKTLSP